MNFGGAGGTSKKCKTYDKGIISYTTDNEQLFHYLFDIDFIPEPLRFANNIKAAILYPTEEACNLSVAIN